MTTQINSTTLKTDTAGARTVVDSLMKKYKEAVAKVSAIHGARERWLFKLTAMMP
jgi:hypothetical protein